MISLSTYQNKVPRLIVRKRKGLQGNEPVSLPELKSYLRISHSKDDEMLISIAKSARESLEIETLRSYVDSVIVSVWVNVSGIITFNDKQSEKTIIKADADFGSGYTPLHEDLYSFDDEGFRLFANGCADKVRLEFSEVPVVPSLAKTLILRLSRWYYDKKGEYAGQSPDWLQKEAAKLSYRTWF